MGASCLIRRIRRRAAREDGVALVLAILVMSALALGAATAIAESSSGQQVASHSKADQVAFNFAEAGLASAYSVLAAPTNNALDPSLLGTQQTNYVGGYAVWGGTLDQTTGTWTLTATGYVPDPAGPNLPAVKRTLTEQVAVQPSYQQPLNNMAWNYIWAKQVLGGTTCDMTIGNSVQVATPLVVQGNLCLQNSATVTNGPLVVGKSLYMQQKQNGVGSASAPINEAHIALGCQYQNKAFDQPCKGSPDNVYAKILDQSIPALTPPTADWTDWYLNASPGPYYPCVTQSGTPPVFDNDQYVAPSPSATHRNDSVATPFNLTPSTSYSCKTPGGEISWDASTDVLTLNGTVYIDGSAYVQNGAINQYQGVGSLYLSGTLLIKNSMLCAGRTGSGCNTASWNPNTQMLVVVADGQGGQVNSGDGIQLVSATFQGALYATWAIETDTTSQVDGPMVGSTVILGQTAATTFPTIQVVPSGMPSNPVVYAQPTTPTNFSG